MISQPLRAAPPLAAAHRIPALDGFRAMAVVIVMLSHARLEHIVPGQFGVTIFFFLSGYLITTLLRSEWQRDGGLDLKLFYLRRSVRILPPLYVSTLLCLLLAAIGANPPIRVENLGYDLFFLTNYFAMTGMEMPLWSLAVEEHFYLAFPILFALLIARGGPTRVAVVCILLCVVTLGLRLHAASGTPDIDVYRSIGTATHTRIDSLLFGCILAVWNNPVADATNRLPVGLSGYVVSGAILLVTFVIRDDWFRHTWRFTIQGVGLMILFNTAIRDPRVAAWLDNPVFTRIALWSYTLYLVHFPILLALKPYEPAIGFPAVATLAYALSALFAGLMYRVVETPLLGWRRSVERTLRRPDRSAPRRSSNMP